ncbi:ankyrin repeat domain-containing protein, partial [bacterium]|nr:ankyrin repeat domain-containing protein [bacterium]
MKKLLEGGIDINAEDEVGVTALFYAVQRDHKDIAELLIRSGADVNHRSTKGGYTALMAVSGQNNVENLQLLLEHGADINVKDHEGRSALFHASEYCNAPTIKLFIDHGADIDDPDKNGKIALVRCLKARTHEEQNVLNAIETLLSAGVDVNEQDSFGQSPAGIAFYSRKLDRIRLIAPKVHGKFWKGAEEDFRKAMDNTELVQLYLDAGADANAGRELGWNLLNEAGSAQTVQLLIKAGADVNASDSNGVTPLIAAVGKNQPEMVRILIAAGAKIENTRIDLLKSALLAGQSDIAQILKDAGAQVENEKELTLKGQISNFIHSGNQLRAEETFRRLEKEFPDADRKAEIFRLGDLYLREALYNESINLHQQVIQNYPGSSSVPLAYYQIAQAYKKLGLESNMAKALEDSLSYSVSNEDSIEFDVPGLYGDAHEELARYYMKTRNWSGALDLWE